MVTAYLNGVKSKGEKTFEEILAPIWEGWRQSGMTEDEIDDLFGKSFRRSGGNGGSSKGRRESAGPLKSRF